MRIDCTAEGHEDNWIVVQTPWTRGDTKALAAANTDEALIEVLGQKLEACHIITAHGGVIDAPGDIDDESIDEIDETVWGWLMGALFAFIGRRRSLGELSARVSSATNGKTPVPQTATK